MKQISLSLKAARDFFFLAVYRISDDIRILASTHPRLVEVEREIVGRFDCVSAPSVAMRGYVRWHYCSP